jgi:VIT1/CCC1 family predicted Fe2+/Mn2+ transporter
MRASMHEEPIGLANIARHYLRDLIYGANDGIITTFAVVAGVTGGSLSSRAVLIVGLANLLGDGMSMGVGNYLSIRSHEALREAQGLPEEEARPARHGGATLAAFVCAGALPLLPYIRGGPVAELFLPALILTLGALFVVGAMRAAITSMRWWPAGLEMLGLGAVVAAVAYGAGAAAAWMLGSG